MTTASNNIMGDLARLREMEVLAGRIHNLEDGLKTVDVRDLTAVESNRHRMTLAVRNVRRGIESAVKKALKEKL